MKKEYFVGVLILLSSLLFYGCNASPDRNFADVDLLFDGSVMPENWELLGVSEEANGNEGQVSGAISVFSAQDTPLIVRCGEDIFRYKSTSKAAWHYERFEEYEFSNTRCTTPWHVPANSPFVDALSADKWRFGCAGGFSSSIPNTGGERTICKYLAQYEEFLVSFIITTKVDGVVYIAIEDVYPIIEAIDRKMMQYLEP